MAVRGVCDGVDVIVRLSTDKRSLLVVEAEDGSLVERGSPPIGHSALTGTTMRIGTVEVALAADAVEPAHRLLASMIAARGPADSRGAAMRRAAQRVQACALVLAAVAAITGLAILISTASSEGGSSGAALVSALVVWVTGGAVTVALWSIGEFLGLQAEEL